MRSLHPRHRPFDLGGVSTVCGSPELGIIDFQLPVRKRSLFHIPSATSPVCHSLLVDALAPECPGKLGSDSDSACSWSSAL